MEITVHHDEMYSFEYRYALLTRALDVTKEDYGDYKLIYKNYSTNDKRHAALLDEGAYSLHWGQPGSAVSLVSATKIPYDILLGSLGYRVCIIHSDTAQKLNQIILNKGFNSLKIGQGIGWPDISIYKKNDMRVVESPTMDGLFSMLGANRFDCLPLGINEASTFVYKNISQFHFLSIEKNFLLHYEFPLYFYVSKKYPELEKRLLLGFKKISDSGELIRLFQQFHKESLKELDLKNRKIVCLISGFSSSPSPCQSNEILPKELALD